MIIEGPVVWYRPSFTAGAPIPAAEALRRVAEEFERRAESAPAEAAEMLRAQAMMARDPALLERMEAFAGPDPSPAEVAERFGIAHPDFRDVIERALHYRRGFAKAPMPRPGRPHILVAHSLSAAEMLELDRGALRGILTLEGGPTSHAAILARSFGIPFLAGYAEAASLTDGQVIRFEVPSPALRFPDVPLLANVSTLDDALAAAPLADGIGLLRTEFLYPSLDYRALVAPFGDRPVVIRALDLGDRDRQPLGVRGIRHLRAHPSRLDEQLAAIAALPRPVSVMAPMVATVEDAAWFVSRARAFGIADAGVMIEVPSAALCADEILEVADFASIGTNDLTQFTLAASREEAALAPYQDASHPAVVRLIETAVTAGKRRGKPVGVCGEAAADPAFAATLVGLGVSSLSLPVTLLPQR